MDVLVVFVAFTLLMLAGLAPDLFLPRDSEPRDPEPERQTDARRRRDR